VIKLVETQKKNLSELVGIPKVVLAQFCRGDGLNWSAFLDNTRLATRINSQE